LLADLLLEAQRHQAAAEQVLLVLIVLVEMAGTVVLAYQTLFPVQQ
jgi:hypothetical protein